MTEKNKQPVNLNFSLDDDASSSNKDFDYLLSYQEKIQAQEKYLSDMSKEKEINNTEDLASSLTTAINNKKKREKKVFQFYLTTEINTAIDVFCRKNNMSKTDAVEMLLRLSLGMKQI